jgi:hypothetical protein
MDIDAIRTRFIQDNLRRALQERDRARASRALCAFRNYFQWFENRIPEAEKPAKGILSAWWIRQGTRRV